MTFLSVSRSLRIREGQEAEVVDFGAPTTNSKVAFQRVATVLLFYITN